MNHRRFGKECSDDTDPATIQRVLVCDERLAGLQHRKFIEVFAPHLIQQRLIKRGALAYGVAQRLAPVIELTCRMNTRMPEAPARPAMCPTAACRG